MIDVAPHNMTSNTAPSPYVASASSTYDPTFNNASKAFNGTVGLNGYWLTAASASGWLQIDLATAYAISSFAVQVNTIPEPNRAPKNFTLQGSNDGTSFTTLATITNQTAWGSGETRTFTVTSPGSYRYYRLDITANNGDVYLQVGELYLYMNNARPAPNMNGNFNGNPTGGFVNA